MVIWKKVFFGAYEINKSGTIRRFEPARGTRKGRKLKAYRIPRTMKGKTYYSKEKYVHLYYGEYNKSFSIPQLLKIAFK